MKNTNKKYIKQIKNNTKIFKTTKPKTTVFTSLSKPREVFAFQTNKINYNQIGYSDSAGCGFRQERFPHQTVQLSCSLTRCYKKLVCFDCRIITSIQFKITDY